MHLLSGLFLVAMSRRRKTAKTAALLFGVVYGLLALIGLIDGNDVLGVIPVNPADNVLHILLSLAGIASALVSRGDDHDHDRTTTTGRTSRVRGREGDVTRTSARVGSSGRAQTLRPEERDRSTRPRG